MAFKCSTLKRMLQILYGEVQHLSLGLIFAKYMCVIKAKYSQEKVKTRIGFHLFSLNQ